jgi:transposase
LSDEEDVTENSARSLQVPLSDEHWELVADIFEETTAPGLGRPRRHPRPILDAILWVETQKESWKHLPSTFPPTQTCYGKFLHWERDGSLAKAFARLGISRAFATSCK